MFPTFIQARSHEKLPAGRVFGDVGVSGHPLRFGPKLLLESVAFALLYKYNLVLFSYLAFKGNLSLLFLSRVLKHMEVWDLIQRGDVERGPKMALDARGSVRWRFSCGCPAIQTGNSFEKQPCEPRGWWGKTPSERKGVILRRAGQCSLLGSMWTGGELYFTVLGVFFFFCFCSIVTFSVPRVEMYRKPCLQTNPNHQLEGCCETTEGCTKRKPLFPPFGSRSKKLLHSRPRSTKPNKNNQHHAGARPCQGHIRSPLFGSLKKHRSEAA